MAGDFRHRDERGLALLLFASVETDLRRASDGACAGTNAIFDKSCAGAARGGRCPAGMRAESIAAVAVAPLCGHGNVGRR